MIFHIIPVGENHSQSTECPCNPDVYSANGHTVVTHLPFDDNYDPTFDDILGSIQPQYSEEITPTYQEDPNSILDLRSSFLLDPDNINLN